MFTRNSIVLSTNIKTPLTAISRAIGNILQLTYGQLVKQLFSNQEQGFAYDPNDLTTLYQDAAGTIPVTAVGQPVGLVLDKSKGLVIGNNLSTDPNFTTPSSWNTAETLGASVSGGKLLFNNVAAYNNAVSNALSSPLVSGRLYKITYQISDYVSGLVRVQLTGGTEANVAALSGNGTFTSYVFAIGNHTFIGFQATIAGTTLKISSLKVEEIAGNHAYQTVSAARPIFQQTPILGNELVANGDFSSGLTNVAPRNVVTTEIVAGALKVTNAGTFYGYAEMALPTEVGKLYLLRGDVVASSGAGAAFHIASLPNSNDIANNVEGSTVAKGVTFTAKTTTTYLSLKTPSNATGSWRIFDNISIKELTGYHTDQNYLAFDGVDDFLQTNNIDFTITDKVSLFAGVRKLSDVNTALVVESSVKVDLNAGAFNLAAPSSTGLNKFSSDLSYGTNYLRAENTETKYSAPISAVLTSHLQRTATLKSVKLRINSVLGAQIQQAPSGSGMGNYPLFIGRRGGVELPFTGNIYSLIGIGRLTTDSETIALEKVIAKNVGVTLNA